MRRVSIIEAKALVQAEYQRYLERGYLTNASSNYSVWLPTNQTVTIGNANYRCVIAIQLKKMAGRGALAMTADREFLWLSDKGKAKLLQRDYKPPLFPE